MAPREVRAHRTRAGGGVRRVFIVQCTIPGLAPSRRPTAACVLAGRRSLYRRQPRRNVQGEETARLPVCGQGEFARIIVGRTYFEVPNPTWDGEYKGRRRKPRWFAATTGGK
jgi:hypothetical protein